MNVRAARLHVLSDLGGSVAAVAAGVVTTATGADRADSVLSLVIVALVVWGAIWLLRETAGVLMARTPEHVDLSEVARELQALPGVVSAHDVHCWTITSGFVAFECHLQIKRDVDSDEVIDAASELLHSRWGIEHVTIQPERVQLITPEAG